MRIPKYISHPLIIIALSSSLFYMLWLNTPSAADLPANTTETATAGAPPQAVKFFDKNTLLKDNNFFQIEDMNADGTLLIPQLTGSWTINDQRFRNLSKQKLEQLKGFFVGKFIKIPDTTVADKSITLPVEIYSPLCFANDPNQRAQTNECPILLQP